MPRSKNWINPKAFLKNFNATFLKVDEHQQKQNLKTKV